MRWPDMSRGALQATLFLFVFTLVLFAANLLFTAHEVTAVRAALVASQRAETSSMQLCQAGNEARAQQIQLWQFVVHISKTPPHQTPAQAAQRARTVRAFEAYLHRVLAPRDCHAITH